MIEVYKGNEKPFLISKCAYNDIYKKLGYKIVSEKNSDSKTDIEVANTVTSNADKFKEEEIKENKDIIKEEVVSSKELNKKVDTGVNNDIFKKKKKGNK